MQHQIIRNIVICAVGAVEGLQSWLQNQLCVLGIISQQHTQCPREQASLEEGALLTK